ncbi:MAG: class I SAM-dependent methyltransferase [Phototrophicaceae bacterium]
MSLQSKGAWWNLVRFGFRLLYHEMAFTYDAVSYGVSLGQWRCWQRSALNFLPTPDAGTLLEIAHGTGNLQLDLHEAGYTSIAYDYSAQMGQIARNKLARHTINGNFSQGLAQQLPFADESFTAIVTTFPTNFIIQPETLQEAYRVLKPDSCLIAVLNGALTSDGIVQKFIESLYAITGQRSDTTQSAPDYFDGYGFTVEMQQIACKGSQAQLVILRK